MPDKPLDTYKGFGGPAWTCWYTEGECVEQKTPHTHRAQGQPSSRGSSACHAFLAHSCLCPLISSLAVFLCPPLLQGAVLRLQGQGKGTIIQLGTGTTSKPWFPSQLPQELHCPGVLCLSRVEHIRQLPLTANVIFPHFREGQVTSHCLPVPHSPPGRVRSLSHSRVRNSARVHHKARAEMESHRPGLTV